MRVRGFLKKSLCVALSLAMVLGATPAGAAASAAGTSAAGAGSNSFVSAIVGFFKKLFRK